MTTTDPVEVVTAFLRAFERFDFTTMSDLMAQDVRLLLPTAPAGVDRELAGKDAFSAFVQQVKLVWGQFRLATCEVNSIGSEGSRVLAEYSSDATNVDGSPYRNSYVTIATVHDGKITGFQESFDPVPLANAMQILAATAPE